MKVCVVGTGYVGLVSGACLADIGHEVVCVDVDAAKVARVEAGEAPIFEDGLDDLLRRNAGKRLHATTSLRDALVDADLALICVGTPFDGQTIDLQQVLSAARNIGTELRELNHYCVVTVKSTVVPGTTIGPVREALEAASGKKAGPDFGLGMNPEFLAEGVAVRDFMNPDRIVAGGIDDRSVEQLVALYAPLVGVPIIRTRPSTAEMIKYASNAFMATLISYSNEIADFCEATDDVDVADVMRGLHEMKHLNLNGPDGARRQASVTAFLWPGCGFGGSCFPKDVKALVSQNLTKQVPTDLLTSVLKINQRRPERMVGMLQQRFPDLRDVAVTVLGLAFKPGTDDVRESPALPIVAQLLGLGARVTCHDPVATGSARTALASLGLDVAGIRFVSDIEAAVDEASAVLLVTSWPMYRDIPRLLEARNAHPLLIDGRRFYDARDLRDYVGIGRPTGMA